MEKILIALFLSAILPLTTQAGEVKIRETETTIFVEYSGEPEAKPAETMPVEAPAVLSVANSQVTGARGEEQISERSKKKMEREEARAKARESKRKSRIPKVTQPDEKSYQEE